MKKIEKIETKERVKLFSESVKSELKYVLYDVEDGDNLDSKFAFAVLNAYPILVCEVFAKEGLATLELERLELLDTFDGEEFMPFVIDNFMFGNGFNLNKYTTDEELDKIANRIINEYNDLVDKEK